MAAKLVIRETTNIFDTLKTLDVGEIHLFPFDDVLDESGEVKERGSHLHTESWRARYYTLLKDGDMTGRFTFRSTRKPFDGTFIMRTE